MTTLPTSIARTETAYARLMARAWAGYHAALWRGDPAVSAFAEWLAGFWEPSLVRPLGEPDARGVAAAGGPVVDWFERDGWVSGYVTGRRGGYLLPRLAILGQPWASPLATAA